MCEICDREQALWVVMTHLMNQSTLAEVENYLKLAVLSRVQILVGARRLEIKVAVKPTAMLEGVSEQVLKEELSKALHNQELVDSELHFIEFMRQDMPIRIGYEREIGWIKIQRIGNAGLGFAQVDTQTVDEFFTKPPMNERAEIRVVDEKVSTFLDRVAARNASGPTIH